MSKPKILHKYHIVGFRVIPKPHSLAFQIRKSEVDNQKNPTPQNRLTMSIAEFDIPEYNKPKRRSENEIQDMLEATENKALKYIESKECQKYRHPQSGQVDLIVSPIHKRVKITIG